MIVTIPKSWPAITTSGVTSNGRPTPSTLRDPRAGKLSTSNSVSNSTASHPALIQKCLNNAHYLRAGESKHGTAVSDNGRNRHGLRNTRLSLQRSFPHYCRMTRLGSVSVRGVGPSPGSHEQNLLLPFESQLPRGGLKAKGAASKQR